MISNLMGKLLDRRQVSATRSVGAPLRVALALGIGCLLFAAGEALAQSGPPAGMAQPASPSEAAPRPTEAPAPATPSETRPIRPPAGVGTLPQNLSPWGMFINADIIVQVVMIGLALASVLTWTVWLAKSIELVAVRRASRGLLDRIRSAGSLTEAETAVQGSRNPVAGLLAAAISESDRSAGLDPSGVKERAALRLERLEAASARRMTRGTGLLATIGATAPFVGLFGTVWGIMNAFVGISKAQTTNLAVVAPGIAEALLATAIGLVAAIPAVVIFNVFARSIAGYRLILGDASAEIVAHLSRDLDRTGRPILRAAE